MEVCIKWTVYRSSGGFPRYYHTSLVNLFDTRLGNPIINFIHVEFLFDLGNFPN